MLHYNAIEPVTLELLKSLMEKDYLQQFVLVGGTALALQSGHRKSVDIDLFTVKDFKSDELIQQLLTDYAIQPLSKSSQTLISMINGVKVDFIRFRYPFIRSLIEEDGIRMLSVENIAPMKLDAVTGRGSKKDFFDVYFLLQNYPLKKLLSLYQEKYPHQTTFHVVKSLTWFADAENDPDPKVLNKGVSWEMVKKTIVREVKKI